MELFPDRDGPGEAAPEEGNGRPGRRTRRRAAPATAPGPTSRVVSVLPTVAGIDRTFDYTVPAELDAAVRVGTVVRADLGGRRVGAWVLADHVDPPAGLALRPLTKVTGWGPPEPLVDLAGWAAWRWAGRRAPLLSTASADWAVRALPPPDLRPPAYPEDPGELAGLAADAVGRPLSIVRLPPAADATALVALVARRGPTLVVVPSLQRAGALAERLRHAGAGVAALPEQWAQARAGAGIVVGARAAAWAPMPEVAAVVVLDAHDEALVQEQAPTWWATSVVAERARRAGAPCVWVTACPTLDLLDTAAPLRPSLRTERRGWAPLQVVDRRSDDPRLGLYSEQAVRALRASTRAVCVLNRTGRARLLACGACGELARCERCGAAVVEAVVEATGPESPHPLVCRRCSTVRPPVCAVCHSTRLRHLRVGVSRVREQLEALVGRPVDEITAASPGDPTATITVGTEAVLHRVGRADLVVFLDVDQELLAPRFRAGEEALALLARASRLVGGRRRDGRVLVQTRSPDHEVLAAAVAADPQLLSDAESPMRAALGLPPARAVALVSGPGAAELAAALTPVPGLDVLGQDDGRWLLVHPIAAGLCDALAATPRPAARVRIEVDPLRV